MEQYHTGNKVIDEGKQGEALVIETPKAGERKLYIESYGCQMNFSDSEIVASILSEHGFNTTRNVDEADVIFVNTCSIREKAEQTVRKRLRTFQRLKDKKKDMTVGVLGSMAERLKSKFLEEEKLVDIVVGPDAYRDLPNLINTVDQGQKAVNVQLSKEETYADISPVRLNSNGVTAFVSIMRGCDNMCTFCVVPFTRGRERSRDAESIVNEVRELHEKGYKEVTLLGQNVDSYLWYGGGAKMDFNKLSSIQQASSVNFAQLLEKVALVSPEMRFRFSTSHPQDMTDQVLETMAKYENICDYIHLPVQSGNTRILEMMNRGYTREWYMQRIDSIKKIIPDCAISQDIISSFCSETEDEHKDTLSLMDYVKFDYGFMFKYSERPNTKAARQFEDDVPEEVKSRRLTEIIEKQRAHSMEHNQSKIGKTYKVLVEGVSKKSDEHLFGRTTHNSVAVFPKKHYKAGDYVQVKITSCNSATLIGESVEV